MPEEEGDDYGTGYYRPPTLGELSRSLARERGELKAFDLEGKQGPPGGSLPSADLARATGIIDTLESRDISQRPPALLYQVVSTYDARPIQAYDFQSSGCDSITFASSSGGVSSSFATLTHSYTVPENTVAVLRGFRYQVIDAPANAVSEGNCWLQSDLFVGDLPVREYNGMKHPVYMQRPFPVFLIVDQTRDIKLRLSHDTNVVLVPDLFQNNIISPVLFELYGNLILKTGVPIEFEVANPIGGGQL